MNYPVIFTRIIKGINGYAKENNFSKAIIGLSSGIDSSVTSVLAAKAFGNKNVLALMMPSLFTKEENIKDAKELAKNLKIKLEIIPINNILNAYLNELNFLDIKDITKAEENLQARIRANILMAYSNKYNYLVLATGNKSEILTGYFTLYGDAVGGIAPLGNLYKTQVYKLAHFINKRYNKIIPESIIKKIPSAELRFNQIDQEILPEYSVLDKILELYIDKKKNKEEIIKQGFDKKTVEKIILLVKNSTFKRSQIPRAIKINS